MARWDRATTNEIPDWFWEATKVKPQETRVEVSDCDVVFRSWGQPGKPGVLLIHGMNAHSHWWDFIAPQLMDEFHLVAMDLTGMGDSDYRYKYSADTYSKEIFAVISQANLGSNVVVVGHSFGGRMATKALSQDPYAVKGLILVDSGIHHPDEPEADYPAMGGTRAKVYPTREAGESRFRLFPPQPCENEYITKYISKHSLMPVDGGYTWKFDEDLPTSLVGAEAYPEDFAGLNLPVALIYGQNSLSYTRETHEYTKSLIPNLLTEVMIEDAQHHVFLDQPLGFTQVLRDVLRRMFNTT